jgi:DNA-binding transcriptional MerR regulator
MPNEQEYSIGELADLAGVTPRTIRYYVSIGLLASPPQAGPKTTYTDGHLKRLRLIRHLQKQHLPLGEIADRLADLDDEDVEAALDRDVVGPPADSALDYINQLRGGEEHARSEPAKETPPEPDRLVSLSLAEPRPAEPRAELGTRTRWERVSLGENVELHVRLPQGRRRHKQIERLIQLGREMLEEGE